MSAQNDGVYLVEVTAESILQCDVKSLTTEPPTGPSGTPFSVTFDPAFRSCQPNRLANTISR